MKEKTNRKKLFAGLTIALVLITLLVVIIVALPKEENGTKKLSIQERLTSGYWYARDPEFNTIFQVSEYTFFNDGTFRVDEGILSPIEGSYERNYMYGFYVIEDNNATLTFCNDSSNEKTFSRKLSYSNEHDTFVWTDEVEHRNMQKAIYSATLLNYDEIVALIDTHQLYLNKNDIPIFECAPITIPEELIIPAINFYKYGHCCDTKTITDEKTLNQLDKFIPAEYKNDSFEVQEVLCTTCTSKEAVMAHIDNCIVAEKPANLFDTWYHFDEGVLEHKITQNQIISNNNKIYLVVSESDAGKNYNKYYTLYQPPSFELKSDDGFYGITFCENDYSHFTSIDVGYVDDTYKIIHMHEYIPGE